MCQNTFEKRMLNTTVPQGMGQALEEDWWPDKPLNPYTSPSRQWKKQRLHLAKGENRNKAGKKKGCGTTSLTRQMKRHHLQQDPSDRDGDGNPWERDGSNSWERGWWREDGLGSSSSWDRPRTGRARAGGAHPGGGGGTAEAPAAAGVPHPCKREQASHLQAGVAGQRPQTGVLAEAAAGAAAEGQRRPGR